MAERLVARSASMLSMSALAPAGLAILGRRWFLGYLTISGCLLLSCCSLIYEQAGGNFDGPPEGIPWLLSPEARRLLADAFRCLEEGGVVDYHVHAVGLGVGGTGIEVNPTCLSWWYPVRRLWTGVFLSAAGILGSEDPDRDYLVRLAALALPFPAPLTCYLFAMDCSENLG